MKHIRLNSNQVKMLGFTDLFIVGDTRAADAGSDFTDADTNQTIDLLTLAVGDVVLAPVLVDVPIAATGATTATASVGVTGAVTQFTAATTVKTSAAFASGEAVAPYVAPSGKKLVLDVTTTVENVSDITAGEVWVWANISRIQDRLTDRIA